MLFKCKNYLSRTVLLASWLGPEIHTHELAPRTTSQGVNEHHAPHHRHITPSQADIKYIKCFHFRTTNHTTMGSIISAIGRAINSIISAIAGLLETIIGGIVMVIVTIFNVITDILCCRCCCGGSRRSSTRGTSRRGGGFMSSSRRTRR